MIQQTSLEAFKTVKVGQRHRQICEALARNGPMSNQDLSMALKLPINCVTPRVFELREMGVVKDSGLKPGPSGTRVHVWRL